MHAKRQCILSTGNTICLLETRHSPRVPDEGRWHAANDGIRVASGRISTAIRDAINIEITVVQGLVDGKASVVRGCHGAFVAAFSSSGTREFGAYAIRVHVDLPSLSHGQGQKKSADRRRLQVGEHLGLNGRLWISWVCAIARYVFKLEELEVDEWKG